MQSGETPQTPDYYSGLGTPQISEMELQLQELVQQGILDPAQAQAYLVEQSQMNGVTQDPATRQAQMEALQGLQDITSSGGLTAIDKAKLGQIGTEEATKARGSREAILQNAQARGLGGSGIELMSQMQNQQEAAGRTSQRDMDVAALAQQRALDALMNQGQLASTVGSQQFNQDATKAQAQDAIAKFNAQNQQQVGLANTASKNAAQVANLGEKQRVSDANAATANKQQQYNKELIQKQFDNEIAKRGGQSGIAAKNAEAQGANSNANAQANNQTIGTALTMAAMMASDERLKENVEDFNASDFLDSLVGHKYNYKDPKKFGEGPRASVMAQDLQKTDIGNSIVKETPEGKMIDTTMATGPILASLADINERLKKQEGK